MYAHALHTVHAVPDLRVAAGRLRDGVSVLSLHQRAVDERSSAETSPRFLTNAEQEEGTWL